MLDFLTYLGKASEKLRKPFDEYGKKQVKVSQSLESPGKGLSSIKNFISERKLNPEIMNEAGNIREQEQKIGITNMFYKGYKITYNFAKFKSCVR